MFKLFHLKKNNDEEGLNSCEHMDKINPTIELELGNKANITDI